MKSYRPHLALFMCNAIWALGYPLYTLVMPHDIQPLALITLSMVGTTLFAMVPLLWGGIERVARRDWLLIVAAAILIALARKMLLLYGMSMTSAIDGSIIASITPVVVLLLSIARGRDHFTMNKGVGLFLAMMGAVAIIVMGGSGEHHTSSSVGNLLIVANVVVTALYMVLLRPLFDRYSSATILLWAYGLGTLIILPFGAHAVADVDFAKLRGGAMWIVLYLMFIPSYIPNHFLNYGLKHLSATAASVYGYVQPLLAVALTVAMGVDKLHWDTALFAAVTLYGIYLVSFRSRTELSRPK